MLHFCDVQYSSMSVMRARGEVVQLGLSDDFALHGPNGLVEEGGRCFFVAPPRLESLLSGC